MNKIEEAVVEIKKRLRKPKEVFAAILYGSVARGDYSARHSDIDILIVLEDLKFKNKVDKIINDINIKYRVRIHPEYQSKVVKNEDQTLLCKLFEEGKLLFSKGFWFMSQRQLGLTAFRLYRFDTAGIAKANKVMLSRALHGRNKKYRGLIDDTSIIDAGKGGVLVRKDRYKDIEDLFRRFGVKYKTKKTIYG